jgi:P2 family phage contractile tail tube protein
MAFQIPKSLHAFAVYIEGEIFAGRVDTAKMPDLTLLTEEFRPGGIDVATDIDMGMEKLTGEITFMELVEDVVTQFGGRGKSITLRGNQRRDGENELVVFRIEGLIRMIGFGDFAPGQRTKPKLEFTADVFQVFIAQENDPVVNIDALGSIRKIGATDQLAQQRVNLGF